MRSSPARARCASPVPPNRHPTGDSQPRLRKPAHRAGRPAITNGRPAGGTRPANKGPLAHDLQAAINLQRAGRFDDAKRDDAKRLYNEILAAHPEYPGALHFLGVLAGQHGTPEAAIDYLTRAIAINHRNPAYHYNLGLAYQAAKKPNEAGKSFRRTLDLDSTHVDALKGMGGALLALGQLDEAEQYCRQAVERVVRRSSGRLGIRARTTTSPPCCWALGGSRRPRPAPARR